LQLIAEAAAARGRMKRKLGRKCILGEGGKRVEGSGRVILGKEEEKLPATESAFRNKS
jgi:hypothetical protein